MSRTEPSRNKPLTARQREWLSHLEAWREQGGTLKAYAREHALSVSGLYTARRQLERRGAWKSPAKTGAQRADPPKLLPVRLTAMPPTPAMVRLMLPNGAVVEVAEHADPRRFGALLAGVMEALR